MRDFFGKIYNKTSKSSIGITHRNVELIGLIQIFNIQSSRKQINALLYLLFYQLFFLVMLIASWALFGVAAATLVVLASVVDAGSGPLRSTAVA